MPEPLTPSALRKDIYNVLDEVLESGEPHQSRRRGLPSAPSALYRMSVSV